MSNTPRSTPPFDLNDRQAVLLFVASLPHTVAVNLVARCAQRIAPLILNDHPDALERLNAAEAVLRVLGAWANGRPISRFTLRQVRDMAYDIADVCDAAGPTLYAAAAAIDADPSRSVVKGLRDVLRLGSPEGRRCLEADVLALASGFEFGPLWCEAELAWATRGWERLQCERPRLLRLFVLPEDDGSW